MTRTSRIVRQRLVQVEHREVGLACVGKDARLAGLKEILAAARNIPELHLPRFDGANGRPEEDFFH
jgi:hypothetical protein